MQANDLRIGNYIRYRDEFDCEVMTIGSYFETHNKDLTDRLYGILCGSDDIVDYNPIPLNDEWLLNGGFDNGNGEVINCDLWDTYWIGGFMLYKEYEGLYTYNAFSEIKYVHQLQNLYFALTGEELIIKDY